MYMTAWDGQTRVQPNWSTNTVKNKIGMPPEYHHVLGYMQPLHCMDVSTIHVSGTIKGRNTAGNNSLKCLCCIKNIMCSICITRARLL